VPEDAVAAGRRALGPSRRAWIGRPLAGQNACWLALGVLYLAWGSTYPAMRVALRGIPPFPLLTMRCLGAGVVLLAVARHRGAPWPTRREWVSSLLVGSLILGVGHGLTTWSMQRADSGIAAVLGSLAPVWMVLFGRLLLHRRPSPAALAGLVASTTSLIALAIAPIGWAAGSVWSLRLELPDDALMATAAQLVAVIPGFALLTAATGEAGHWHTHPSAQSWLALLYVTVIGYVVGFAAYTWLLRMMRLSTVSTYAYVAPVLAVAVGSWLLHEVVGTGELIGSAIVLAAVAVVSRDGGAVEPLAPPALPSPAPVPSSIGGSPL
jgi:drug/metabolite transporter (DMT)-like permease